MAIVLAVAASLCTAASSVCQRMGAKSGAATGFDAGLLFRLARRPVWLLGIAAMIGGFVLQLAALHFGALALVQPILAAELVFVFGYLAVAGSGRVRRRDWLSASLLGMFLFGEHIRTGAADLAGEALALAAVIAAAAALSRSCHVACENSHPVKPGRQQRRERALSKWPPRCLC